MKILLAIDSFKGCLTSEEAEAAVRDGLRASPLAPHVSCFPMADGGEGLLDVMLRLTQGTRRTVDVTGPLGEPLRAAYGISGTDGRTAFVELASAAGLPLVPAARRDPSRTTTLGVGQLILDALRQGCRHIIIGLGGSATNDAGLGLLKALGYRFLDEAGQQLPGCGAFLAKVRHVDASAVSPLVREATFEAVCDVTSPFYGPLGAACVFAPQKGADPEMVAALDGGLRSFSRVIREATGCEVSALPGAGAAGGVGGALAAFLGARMMPGADFVLRMAGFDEALSDASLVITGEGHVDRQSAMGKVVGTVLRHGQAAGVPVVVVCGGHDEADALNDAGAAGIFSIVPGPVSLAQAMDKDYARTHLRSLARQIGSLCAGVAEAS